MDVFCISLWYNQAQRKRCTTSLFFNILKIYKTWDGWESCQWLVVGCVALLVYAVLLSHPTRKSPFTSPFIFFRAGFFWLVGLVDFRPLYRIPQSLSLLLPLVNSTVNAISEKPFLSGIMKWGRQMARTTNNNCLSWDSNPRSLGYKSTR